MSKPDFKIFFGSSENVERIGLIPNAHASVSDE